MSQAKKIGYSVTIIGKQSCFTDKSKYNKSFNDSQSVEACNYFHTLADHYQCHRLSRPDDSTKQAEGLSYTIVLKTILAQ